jgi:hypothetical protein
MLYVKEEMVLKNSASSGRQNKNLRGSYYTNSVYDSEKHYTSQHLCKRKQEINIYLEGKQTLQISHPGFSESQ